MPLPPNISIGPIAQTHATSVPRVRFRTTFASTRSRRRATHSRATRDRTDRDALWRRSEVARHSVTSALARRNSLRSCSCPESERPLSQRRALGDPHRPTDIRPVRREQSSRGRRSAGQLIRAAKDETESAQPLPVEIRSAGLRNDRPVPIAVARVWPIVAIASTD